MCDGVLRGLFHHCLSSTFEVPSQTAWAEAVVKPEPQLILTSRETIFTASDRFRRTSAGFPSPFFFDSFTLRKATL